jgi:hypothetical protein
MKLGYARVSTNEQDTAAQVSALESAGCEKIFREKVRPEVDGTGPSYFDCWTSCEKAIFSSSRVSTGFRDP